MVAAGSVLAHCINHLAGYLALPRALRDSFIRFLWGMSFRRGNVLFEMGVEFVLTGLAAEGELSTF